MVVDRFAVESFAVPHRPPEPGTAHEAPERRRGGVRHVHSPLVPAQADERDPRARAEAAQESPVAADAEPDDPRAHVDWDAGPETVPLHGREPDDHAHSATPGEPDEESVIIVEEEYDDAEPALARPVRPVHRQEYAQLFARLRRGE
jgi:hypothetical protein